MYLPSLSAFGKILASELRLTFCGDVVQHSLAVMIGHLDALMGTFYVSG
tara:strand:+ start:100267 stop:100413 length:147 start_codon:yes stop_codon:yes gene_type:complete